MYTKQHLDETISVIQQIDIQSVEAMANLIASTRDKSGRIFFIGVGGSAANASHAVNDFRKIAGIECYAPTDNVSELTARTNDEGWENTFSAYLATSNLSSKDLVFILSVGGGNAEKNISPNIVQAVDYAKSVGATVTGIVGRDGGHTFKSGESVVLIPTVNPDNVTPHSEAMQGVIWHLLVSHPLIKAQQTKWESTKP